jgi:hypothetical protein
MTPSREDLELYVSGNYDGDVAALERAIVDDPAVAAIVAEEARFDMLLRDAAAAATFCAACNELVRGERCDSCGAAVRPGGYLVERVLVSNAHGRMYIARDADGKRVALKELAFVHAPSPAALAALSARPNSCARSSIRRSRGSARRSKKAAASTRATTSRKSSSKARRSITSTIIGTARPRSSTSQSKCSRSSSICNRCRRW